jgi:hypothetical protein
MSSSTLLAARRLSSAKRGIAGREFYHLGVHVSTLTHGYPLEAHLWSPVVQFRAEAQPVFCTYWNHHAQSPDFGDATLSEGRSNTSDTRTYASCIFPSHVIKRKLPWSKEMTRWRPLSSTSKGITT